jgi:hypothetical protein
MGTQVIAVDPARVEIFIDGAPVTSSPWLGSSPKPDVHYGKTYSFTIELAGPIPFVLPPNVIAHEHGRPHSHVVLESGGLGRPRFRE